MAGTFTREQIEKSIATRKANAAARRAAKVSSASALDPPAGDVPFTLPPPAAELDDDFAAYELSEAEKAEIDAEVNERLRKERKAAAKKAYAQDAIDRERRKAGEEPVAEATKRYLEEIVEVTVQMPRLRKPVGGRHEPEPIILDQKAYRSGVTYPVTRAIAVTLLDIMDKAGRHVRQVDGDSMVDFNPASFQLRYQGGVPTGGGSLGGSFDSIHRRRS